MKKKTLQLFQLLLAVFGFYAAYHYSGYPKTIIPLVSLVFIFLLDKIETFVGDNGGKITDAETERHESMARQAREMGHRLECLLYNKNVLALTDAIQGLLRELDINVTTPTGQQGIDRIISIETQKLSLALKVAGDTNDISPEWEQWKKLEKFTENRNRKQPLLIIANNWDDGVVSGKKQFTEYSEAGRIKLAANHIVGMTTLTFYKLYRLCKEKGQKPENFFQLISQHPGGIFRLEDYAKK